MTPGEQALEQLLARVDGDQAGGGERPQAGDGNGLGCPAVARGGAEPRAEHSGAAEDDPGRERVEIGVALRGQLGACVTAEGEQVAQLVHGDGGDGQQDGAAPAHRTSTFSLVVNSSKSDTRADTASVQRPRLGSSVCWAT